VVEMPNTRRPEAALFTAPRDVTSCVLVSVPKGIFAGVWAVPYIVCPVVGNRGLLCRKS